LRILNLVHQYLPEHVGGTELYTQALSRALVNTGNEVGIFYRSFNLPDGLHQRREEGITHFAASDGPTGATRRFLDSFHAPRLQTLWEGVLDDFKPDLVLVQHLMGLPFSCLELLRRRNLPYVITLLDYWWVCANANLLTNHDEQPCNGPNRYLNCTRCAIARAGHQAAWLAAPAATGALALRAAQLRRAMAGARLLLTPSDFVTQWYQAHGAPAQIRTARWGIMPPENGIPKRPSSTTDRPLQLLYVGGLAPNKGVHVVLKALQDVRGEWTLRIAGDTSKHPEHVRSLQELASPRVTFTGTLDRAGVWQAMAESDIVLVPSLWHETFCLVAHEAVAAGAVLYASAMGALSEAITDGHGGRLLPAGDVAAWRTAIQQAVDDRAYVAKLRAGRPAIRRFPEHADEVSNLLHRIGNSSIRKTLPSHRLHNSEGR